MKIKFFQVDLSVQNTHTIMVLPEYTLNSLMSDREEAFSNFYSKKDQLNAHLNYKIVTSSGAIVIISLLDVKSIVYRPLNI